MGARANVCMKTISFRGKHLKCIYRHLVKPLIQDFKDAYKEMTDEVRKI